MSGRPFAAVALSVLVHVAVVGAAALAPLKVAAESHAASPRATLAHGADAADAPGAHGNTIEIERADDGELGAARGGARERDEDRERPAEPVVGRTSPATTAPTATGPTATGPVTTAPAVTAPARERRRVPKTGSTRPRPRPQPTAATTSTPSGAGTAPPSDAKSTGASGQRDQRADGRDGGEGGAHGQGQGQRHGTTDAAERVIPVGGALAHAIPMAFSAHPMWHDLALGVVAKANVSIVVENGKVTRAEYPDPKTPALIRRIVEGAIILLRARPARLSLGSEASGVERLAIEVTLSQRELTPAQRAQGAKEEKTILAMSYAAPTADTPGNGSFTFATGRHVEIAIALRP